MKPIFLIPLIIIGTQAVAATRCIPFNAASISCTATNTPAIGATNWESVCTIGTISMRVQGIGVCASDNASVGAVRDTVHISANAAENVRCWCKITTPATSKWVAYAECSTQNCASRCQLNGTGYADVRTALFNNWEY
ncbi:MAG: hypothetical protein K2L94_04245 [Alphaproteobacteria bacterium]|nr:hypothetical protein [Alphaproteobacteria bacterium]